MTDNWQFNTEQELSKLAVFVSDKIEASKVTLGTYISTENMQVDRGGVVPAIKLPMADKFNYFRSSDTLFSNIRTYFKKVWLAEFDGGASADVLIFRTKNPEILDPIYLSFLLSSEDFIDYTVLTAKGAKMPRGDKSAIMQYKFFLPEIEKQRKIGNDLLCINKKIELNRQTNRTLEEMAQAVFKSWFVDFEPTRAKINARENGQDPTRAVMAAIAGKTVNQVDTLSPEQIETLTATADFFPDTLVPAEFGEIPDGWEAKPLYDTAEYVNGAAFKAVDFCDPQEGLPIIKIAELKQGIYDGTKYTLKEVKPRHFITNDDVLYSWSGSPETSLEVFKWFGGDGWLNQHIFKLNFGSDEQKYFTYYLLKHMKPVLISIAQDKQTTGLGHVTVADMKRLLVPYPNGALLREFKRLIAPLYEQCSKLEKEIITLSEIRDALLPRLLSGDFEINGEVAQ